MRRISLASLILLAGLVQAAEVAPFEVPATPPSSSGSIGATNTVAISNAGLAKRVVSPMTAAKLGAATPQFQVPADEVMVPTQFQLPADMAPAPESASPIFRSTVETRHAVVQLPRFIVREPRLPDPLQVLTTKGREELAFQRRPGLRVVPPLAQMNANIAVDLLGDDLRAQRAVEAAQWMGLYTIKESTIK
jgi:hypothetical protein